MDSVFDCSVLPYRKGVGALVFNHEGKVWVGRRLGTFPYAKNKTLKRWQLPQGGIEEGEEPLGAALRELYEETGIRSVKLIKEAPDWFCYDFPPEIISSTLDGKYRGQIQKWFAFQFVGQSSEIALNLSLGHNGAEFDRWKWVDLEILPSIVISFKKHIYVKVVSEFRNSFRYK